MNSNHKQNASRLIIHLTTPLTAIVYMVAIIISSLFFSVNVNAVGNVQLGSGEGVIAGNVNELKQKNPLD